MEQQRIDDLPEEELLALDRAMNDAKNNGAWDRVAADAALRAEINHNGAAQ